MRKFAALVVSTAGLAALFAAPTTASASCHQIVGFEELGCIESVVCGSAGTVLSKVPGRPIDDEINCVM